LALCRRYGLVPYREPERRFQHGAVASAEDVSGTDAVAGILALALSSTRTWRS
jgi:hypothetical protein